MNRISPRTRQVLLCAAKEARGQPVRSEHLLLAVLRTEGSIVSRALQNLGCSYDEFLAFIEKRKQDRGTRTSVSAETILEQACFLAEEPPLQTDHLIFALLATDGSVGVFLKERGIARAEIEREIQRIHWSRLAKFFTTAL